MSLLNEMLHDLANQKHVKQVTPILIPDMIPSRRKSNKSILLLGIVFGVLILYGFLFTKQVTKMVSKRAPELKKGTLGLESSNTTQTSLLSSEKEKRMNESLKVEALGNINSRSVPLPSQNNRIPVQPVTLVSYIEPIVSPASHRVPIEFPVAIAEEEVLNKESVTQQNPPFASSGSINKVYAAQTLEEWRDNQFNKALEAIDKGFDEQAIDLLQEILLKIPNASDVRENLAALFLAYKDFNQAAEVVNEGLKYSPSDAALITIKARIFLDQGKAVAAINLLGGHRPSITSYPDFYATLAAAYQSEGRILEAGSIYQSLIQIDPHDGRYWLGYAIALEHNHKLNQAIEAYLKASQNPESEPTVRAYAVNRLKFLQG